MYRILILLMIPNFLFAQIPNVSIESATIAANYLKGPGVTIFNASFSGDALQLAKFSDGYDKIGISEGILITTGEASFASTWGTSNSGDDQPVNSSNTDVDLDQFNGVGSVKDAAILEFDFTTTGAEVKFEVVFASEEYPEYVNSNYNDAFGLFVSGPGISGPYSNGAVNMATLPNGDPITINDVNHLTNSSYFNYNVFNNPAGNVLTESTAQLAYDGFTNIITVKQVLQCQGGEVYHVKIAICNTGDHLLDSGVFIKRASIRSNFLIPHITSSAFPVCEGDEITLNISSDPSFDYSWSTGQSGVGLSQIATISSVSTNQYGVTVTNLDGCQLSRNINVIVHSQNNIPPYFNGYNNTGEDTYYTQVGESFCFDIQSFDSYGEKTDFIPLLNSHLTGSFFSLDNNFQEGAEFCWTPTVDNLGINYIVFKACDNNQCGELCTVDTIFIKVVCEFCPLTIYYENRNPSADPLPAETFAGKSIVAGYSVDPSQTNGNVDTGDDDVEFRAPKIDLMPGFTSGPNFDAIIDLETCVDDCNSCCDDWNGFTIDLPLPNVITPNNDGTNDFWYPRDNDNSFCAFNALSSELYIYNRWGVKVYEQKIIPSGCCSYQAPSSSLQIPHSTIYWDGKINVGALNSIGSVVTDDTYYYVLKLHGCGNNSDYTGFISVFGSPSGMIIAGDSGVGQISDSYVEEVIKNNQNISIVPQLGSDETTVADALKADLDISIYPNPSSTVLNIETVVIPSKIRILDSSGKLIFEQYPSQNRTTYNSSTLADGVYYVEVVFFDERSIKQQFIKTK